MNLVLWQAPENNFTVNAQDINQYKILKIAHLDLQPHLLGGCELTAYQLTDDTVLYSPADFAPQLCPLVTSVSCLPLQQFLHGSSAGLVCVVWGTCGLHHHQVSGKGRTGCSIFLVLRPRYSGITQGCTYPIAQQLGASRTVELKCAERTRSVL